MTEWSNTVEKRRRKKKADSLGYLKFAITNSYRMRRLKLREERRQQQKEELRKELEEKAALRKKNEFFKRVPIVLCTKYNSTTKERTLEADKKDLPKVDISQKSEIRNVRRKILCNISNINSNPTQLSPTLRTDIVSQIIENNNNNPAELLLSDGNNSMSKYKLNDLATLNEMKFQEINLQRKRTLDHLKKVRRLERNMLNKTF